MQKNILVPFTVNHSNVSIDVSYTIEMDEDIQTIVCTISRNEQNAWLELYKFGYRSRLEDGSYTQLFYENQNIKNINTSMFIDEAYAAIMKKEKFRLELV